jgi:hypothetical protein
MTTEAQNKVVEENSALSETRPLVARARVYDLHVDLCAYLEIRFQGGDTKRVPLDKTG